MVKRLFVEKKKDFDVESRGLYDDIRANLHIEGLKDVKVINRYDIDNISDEIFEMVKYTVFAEPAIDITYEETLDTDGAAHFFAAELLSGQYDQRADSAQVCIRLIEPEAQPIVRYAKITLLYGDISEDEFQRIKAYCINPVDSQEAIWEKTDTLEVTFSEPTDVETIHGFIDEDEEALKRLIDERGFAMSSADMREVHRYFKEEEMRDPTITELKVIDTYWSDHCRHTTFNTKITDVKFDDTAYGEVVRRAFDEYMQMRDFVYGEDSQRDVSLMDMACIGAKYMKKKGKLNDLDESEEINACSIRVKATVDGKEEDWLVMFKNETHNHPTEIEPFGGAATCLGGAIRDPLSGRSYVYQAMRVTGAADPRTPIEKTLSGKLPQIKITREAAAGYSSYGNQIGLATGLVDEIYHPDYVAKRMEVGAVIAAAPLENVIRKKPEAGDVVILVGGRTGRDGCGGATGSSKEHTEESMESCGAEVQKGNPPVERNIQRLFRRKEVSTLIKKCNDFGAGGVSVAIGELADGLNINLDVVPKKYNGLDGTEIAISESQERMAVVVAEKDVEAFIEYSNRENLEATPVATVTDDRRVNMFWRGKNILSLSRDFLDTNGAKQETSVIVYKESAYEEEKEEMSFIDALRDLNCCSKKGLIERFDSTIGGNTVLMPLGGKYQLSPAIGMAAKLPIVKGETETATLMTYGYDADEAKKSPYHGAMYAVIDSATKIVAMGGKLQNIKLSFQEYFEKLTDDNSWGKPMAALLGALKVQKELEIAAIGGKDSMSGTFMDIKVPPALISFAVDVASAENIISTEFKRNDSAIIFVKGDYDENGVLDFESYKKKMKTVEIKISQKEVLSANTIGKGGVFVSAVKMAVGNKIGFTLKNVPEEVLLNANYGGMLLEVSKLRAQDVARDVNGVIVGFTDKEEKFVVSDKDFSISIKEAIDKWTEPLEYVFPTKTSTDDEKVPTISFEKRSELIVGTRVEKPLVIIPMFPGTNCEMDSARAFQRAGAETDIHIIRNITTAALEESIKSLADKIRRANIIMIPGGFSGGDEPDGSAKFITAIFRNPLIKEAVTDLLEKRDGLIIGICNGFQALIKLGLVPFGRITDADENSPTLSYNKIGRHMSRLVNTRIASVKSPWLSKVNCGDVFNIAVSHGEGRFICSESLLNELAKNGQIITQYVDEENRASMDIEHNPNGSAWAIEGITSPDGRVLGKMGHSERIGENVYKNVYGEKDMKLFEAAVSYFRNR